MDAFQGGEKEIVFLSCCRSRRSEVGFVDNRHRLNVAISRAKRHLIIIGHSKYATAVCSSTTHGACSTCEPPPPRPLRGRLSGDRTPSPPPSLRPLRAAGFSPTQVGPATAARPVGALWEGRVRVCRKILISTADGVWPTVRSPSSVSSQWSAFLMEISGMPQKAKPRTHPFGPPLPPAPVAVPRLKRPDPEEHLYPL